MENKPVLNVEDLVMIQEMNMFIPSQKMETVVKKDIQVYLEPVLYVLMIIHVKNVLMVIT